MKALVACEESQIYDISYNTCGYPTFLIYFNNQWVRKSAKYFRPIEED